MSKVPNWSPPVELSFEEEALIERLGRVRKLFRFLRLYRHELFDDAFQTELATMYRETGAGKTPLPPALLCMVTLLQAYMQVSDAEAVELTVVDRRWQMVLDCLGATQPLFSQGVLPAFRARLIKDGLDARLFQQTIALAERTGAFDPKALTRLRLALDSAPFDGAGRVEDTLNLLGHAARNLLSLCCYWLDQSRSSLAARLGLRLLDGVSVKARMDIDWNDERQRQQALADLYEEVQLVVSFARNAGVPELGQESSASALAIEQIVEQNLDLAEGIRIRQGVAKDRRITIEDSHMRHGRKSSARRFDGYKRHIGIDLDSGLVLHCGISAANSHDSQHMEQLRESINAGGWQIGELHIDRGYLPAALVNELYENGTDVVAKTWTTRRGDKFGKSDFRYNLRDRTITCPAGQTTNWQPGERAEFPLETCRTCPMREKCTSAEHTGRTISMQHSEVMHEKLRRQMRTPKGRKKLRQRVAVEHAQAHLVARQGRKARYRGEEKNLMDVRRCAALLNLHTNLRYLDGIESPQILRAA